MTPANNRDAHGDTVSEVAHAPATNSSDRDAHGDAVSSIARGNSGGKSAKKR
jgi:hypothetical protein